ncbi:MAG: hypothetical protein HGA75_04230 [Thiobacillus sp.]|nr:hypothetical protein [Thiobacillus sp.]
MSQPKHPHLTRLALFGLATVLLYWALFHYEAGIVGATQHGHWSFVIPIALAFVFSFFHGNFTGGFWDVLGIRANKH